MLPLRSLYKEIRLHLAAKPENQNKILDYVRNNGRKREPLRKGTRFVKNGRDWYEEICELGKGRTVMSSDDVATRSLGFHIFDKFKNGKDKHGETLMVPLIRFKQDLPQRIKKLFRTPQARKDFAERLRDGKVPKLSKS